MRLPRFITEPMIRRKAGFRRLHPERYTIRVARTVAEYEQAFRLVHAGYVFQGIEPLDAPELRITDQHLLPESTVLLAYEGDQIVGTMTVTADSPAGLPLDKDYPEPLQQLRQRGEHLAEYGSFAVVGRCQGTGVAQLLSLACNRIAFGLLGASRIVIGVHPQAERFFQAVWGFEPLGEAKGHAELSAPVLGMHVHHATMLEHLRRYFPQPLYTGATPAEHIQGGPPVPGLELPGICDRRVLTRWKMPRDVFRTLFVDRENHVDSLAPPARDHLERNRSDQTLGRIPESAA